MSMSGDVAYVDLPPAEARALIDLASQIVDEYGRELGGGTIRLAGNFQSALTSRLSMPREAQPGIFM